MKRATSRFHVTNMLLVGILLGLGAGLMADEVLAVPSITVVGSLPRDTAASSFPLAITITNIVTEDGTATISNDNDAVEFMKRRIRVKFTGVQGSTALKYDSSNPTDKAYLTSGGGNAQSGANSSQTLNLSITVTALGDTLTNTFGDSKNVVVDLLNIDATKTTPISSSPETPIIRDNSAPNAAPALVSLESGNKQLKASWVVDATIAYTDGKSKAPPTSTRMFWVEQTTDTITLDAKEFSGTSASDVSTTCQLDTEHAATNSACVTCDASKKIYLSGVQSDSRVRSGVVTGTSGTTGADLNLEKSYVVFVMYESLGLVRSACFVIICCFTGKVSA